MSANGKRSACLLSEVKQTSLRRALLSAASNKDRLLYLPCSRSTKDAAGITLIRCSGDAGKQVAGN
jgi:hypothetical protein